MKELLYSSTIGKLGTNKIPKYIKPIFLSELVVEEDSARIVSRKISFINNTQVIELYPSCSCSKSSKVKERLQKQNDTMNALKKINNLFK